MPNPDPELSAYPLASETPNIIEIEQDERAIFEKICQGGDIRGARFDPVHNLYVGANHKIQWNIDKAKHINAAWFGWKMSIANRKDKAKIVQLQKQIAELTHEKAVLQQQLPDHQFPEQADHAKALLLDPTKEPAIAGHGAFWKERGQDCSQLTGSHPGELSFGISYMRSQGFECHEHALIRLTDYRVDMTALRAYIAMLDGQLCAATNWQGLSDDERVLARLAHQENSKG